MSREVISSLREWDRERRCGTEEEIRDFLWSAKKRELSDVLWEEAPQSHTGLSGLDVGVPPEPPWRPRGLSQKLEPMARCRLIAFDGREAECAVFVDGYELPKVSFPAWVLKRKGLAVGARFIWIMRDPARVRPADIDASVPQTDEMSRAEQDRLDELYRAFQQRREEDRGEWPEHTGPGR
jgi:hypothetical protein